MGDFRIEIHSMRGKIVTLKVTILIFCCKYYKKPESLFYGSNISSNLKFKGATDSLLTSNQKWIFKDFDMKLISFDSKSTIRSNQNLHRIWCRCTVLIKMIFSSHYTSYNLHFSKNNYFSEIEFLFSTFPFDGKIIVTLDFPLLEERLFGLKFFSLKIFV